MHTKFRMRLLWAGPNVVLKFGHSASNGAPSARANVRAISLTWEMGTFRNGKKWVCRDRIPFEYLGNGWSYQDTVNTDQQRKE